MDAQPPPAAERSTKKRLVPGAAANGSSPSAERNVPSFFSPTTKMPRLPSGTCICGWSDCSGGAAMGSAVTTCQKPCASLIQALFLRGPSSKTA